MCARRSLMWVRLCGWIPRSLSKDRFGSLLPSTISKSQRLLVTVGHAKNGRARKVHHWTGPLSIGAARLHGG